MRLQMAQADFLKYLDGLPGVCKCPQLEKLREARKAARTLAEKCDRFKSEVDLKYVSHENRKFLVDYAKAVSERDRAIGEYEGLLAVEVEKDNLYLRLYEGDSVEDRGKVDLRRAIESRRNPLATITLNCSRCGTYITQMSSAK